MVVSGNIISFIQPKAGTILFKELPGIPLTTREQVFYYTDVCTLNKCFIIIILIFNDSYCCNGTLSLQTLKIPSTNQIIGNQNWRQ